MDVIALRLLNTSRCVTVDPGNGRVSLRETPPPLDAAFQRVQIDHRQVTLRPYVRGGYLAVGGGDVLTTSDSPWPFVVLDGPVPGRVMITTIVSHQGRFLTAHADGTLRAIVDPRTHEEMAWVIEPLDALIAALTFDTCCGKVPSKSRSGGVIYNAIVAPLVAALMQLARPISDALNTTVVPWLATIVNALFSGSGSPAADEPPKPGASKIEIALWQGFHAANRAPHASFDSHYHDGARRECIRFFRQSLIAPDDVSAAHDLGLALHFFQDLCKPMHAANFRPLLGDPSDAFGALPGDDGRPGDWRHGGFESLVAAAARGFQAAPLPAELADCTDIEGLADRVAADANAIFREHLRERARAKIEVAANGKRFIPAARNVWTAEEAGPALPATLQLAANGTAALLRLWWKHQRVAGVLPPEMHERRTGKWLFRENDDAWWPGGAQKSLDATVSFGGGALQFTGAYDFLWWEKNAGELSIRIFDITADALTIQVRHRSDSGNIWNGRGTGGAWRETLLRHPYSISGDGTQVTFGDGVQRMAMRRYGKQGWQPAVRFDLLFYGRYETVVFELRP